MSCRPAPPPSNTASTFRRAGRALRAVCLLGACSLAACGPLVGLRPLSTARAGQTTYHQIVVDGMARTFLLHLPPQAANGPVPLVLLFHGYRANGAIMRDQSGMDAQADARGNAVVYPDGTGRWKWLLLGWNAVTCCGWARHHAVDDVAFAKAVVDTLVALHLVDPHRVAAAGFSAGGMLALRLACEHPETFDAAADVAGAMPDTTCHPRRAVPVLLVQGGADEELRFDLRTLHKRNGNGYARSMEQALAFWARQNQCGRGRERDSTELFVAERATGCPVGHGAELLTVLGNPHAWPGSDQVVPFYGPEAAPLDGSAAVLDFFAQYGIVAPAPQR